MKKILFSMFAIMALLASCMQDDAFDSKSAILGISAELPSQTRAIKEKTCFVEGDVIILWVNGQQALATYNGSNWTIDKQIEIEQPTMVQAYYNLDYDKYPTVRPDDENIQHEILSASAEVSPERPLAQLSFEYILHCLNFEITKSKDSRDGDFVLESLTLKNKAESKSPIYTDIIYNDGVAKIPGELTILVDKKLDYNAKTTVEALAIPANEADDDKAILSLRINGQDYETEIDLSCLKNKKSTRQTLPVSLTLIPKPNVPYSYAVDLGLSVKWASFNVGAEYRATEYGDYLAWGEIEPKDLYSPYTYKWYDSTKGIYTKYCVDNTMGSVDNRKTLELADDVAQAEWSGKWRMPTQSEMRELIEKCTWKWDTRSGIKGYTVTGANGNSIFLPTGDFRRSSQSGIDDHFGYYWTSSTGVGSTSYCLLLNGYEQHELVALEIREMGCLVRPVY